MLAQRTRTKIVATVGPACSTPDQLLALIRAGVDVFRVNMAHGQRSQHDQVVADIRAASSQAQRPIAILIDLAGPKIRLGELHTNPTECPAGASLRFVRGDRAAAADELVSNYPPLIDELNVDDPVMLADGTVSMLVVEKERDSVVCRVTGGGEVRSRQGINLPGVKLSVPALTDHDRDNAAWAARSGVDFVSLSFVRSPDEIHELRKLLRSYDGEAHIVAKIEKPEALDCLDEVVDAADAIMVARGDLGVEIDVARTPVVQKQIIATSRAHQKPVIVATQMLDSMQHSRRPTRAEATDVANAVLDGADACMLSGETAVGTFPTEAAAMMARILSATEATLVDSPAATEIAPKDAHPITSAAVLGAAQVARRLESPLVVIATRSGNTARIKAAQRDVIPTVAVSDSEASLRRMCLYWGVTPMAGAPLDDGPALRSFIARWGRADGCLQRGDRVVFVSGTEVVPAANNAILVREIE